MNKQPNHKSTNEIYISGCGTEYRIHFQDETRSWIICQRFSLLIFGCRFESLRLWSCDKLGPLLMVGLLALSCALLIWASREPAKKWAPADAWRDNARQISLGSQRVQVRVYLVLSGRQIVVEDSRRQRWLLEAEENAPVRKFVSGEIIWVEKTKYFARPDLLLVVPKVGYHFVIPLRYIEPWRSTEI